MPPPETRSRRVDSGGVGLHVREQGPADAGRHVLLVHGYPDDAAVWDGVAAELPADWHVIRYDVRGAGRSDAPRHKRAYLIPRLLEDLLAVVEATVPPGDRVHLAAHDWGGIGTWPALTDEAPAGLRDRIASYTCVSGPSLDHLGRRLRSLAGLRALLLQVLVHSWYVWLFQLPFLPELLWGRGQRRLRPLLHRIDPTTDTLGWGPALARLALPGIRLYRANIAQRLLHPRDWRTTVPVRLVVPLRDGFVTPESMAGLEARCARLDRVEVDDGHWVLRTQPGVVAGHVAAHVRACA